MRRNERIKVEEATRLRPNGWSSLEVQIVDFSEAGFRARCEAAVNAGSCISIDVPGIGAVEAQVSWRRHGEIGARFLEPIALERCSWAPAAGRSILARLLVQRAAARTAGLAAQERQLERQIAASLPMVKLGRG